MFLTKSYAEFQISFQGRVSIRNSDGSVTTALTKSLEIAGSQGLSGFDLRPLTYLEHCIEKFFPSLNGKTSQNATRSYARC